jgi:hypothetical protein
MRLANAPLAAVILVLTCPAAMRVQSSQVRTLARRT